MGILYRKLNEYLKAKTPKRCGPRRVASYVQISEGIYGLKKACRAFPGFEIPVWNQPHAVLSQYDSSLTMFLDYLFNFYIVLCLVHLLLAAISYHAIQHSF